MNWLFNLQPYMYDAYIWKKNVKKNLVSQYFSLKLLRW